MTAPSVDGTSLISVTTATGQGPVAVIGERVSAHLAITPSITGDTPASLRFTGMWAITHIPSGYCATGPYSFLHVDDLRVLARKYAQQIERAVWERLDLPQFLHSPDGKDTARRLGKLVSDMVAEAEDAW